MDLATQQILSGLTAGESRDSEGGAGGLTNFGNKVKEYWNTVKTEPLAQAGYGNSDEIRELMAEKDSLDSAFKHAARLLEQEIVRLQNPESQSSDGMMMMSHMGGGGVLKTSEKIYIPPEEQRRFNLVGRLLGPKGLTLKRMQAETQTKMTILGRGSMRDKKKEEELRTSGDPMHAHLSDDLHILIEVAGPFNEFKLLAGIAEVRKMMIPSEQGMSDPMGMKYLSPEEQQMYAPVIQGPPRGRGGGGGPMGRGGGSMGRGGGGGHGNFGSPRGRGGRGGGGPMRGRGGRGGGGMRGGGGGRGRGGGGGRGGGMGRGRGRTGMHQDMGSYQQDHHVGYGDSRQHDRDRGGSYGDQGYSGGAMGGGGDRRSSGGYGSSQLSSDPYGSVAGNDQYYSSFADNSTGSGDREWSRSSRSSRTDNRYHPYQSGGGNNYY